ncbi:hypothetical protein BFW87_07540 [Pseudomonas fluorescens]|uniref:Uncharacterized protein n=1 Tax=Pseudomonas fluorescens TaxID=294 RepID=A0A1T2YZ67_PSEFL|nr:hypothetical protein [Pseudomonas fluorescens]OPA97534.1 hypothetical protein BFW87_07540 [Pseudomonas fluorescens]
MTLNTINVAGFGSAKNAAPQTNDNVNSAPPARSESVSSADARLKQTYLKQPSPGARLPVPAESTLGRWIEALQTVFTSSAFTQLEQSVSGEGSSITHIDPNKGILYFGGHARLTAQSAQLNDIPGARDLFDRLMTLAKRFTPYDVLHLPTQIETDVSGQRTVDSSIVGQFLYGPDSKASSDHHVPADILSKTGESETRHNLLAALKKQTETPGTKPDMESIVVEIAPHSAYWLKDQPQPFTMSLKQLLTAYGLQVPTTPQALANLERVLFAPPLTAPTAGDYGGLLSKSVPLSEDSQKKIIETVSTWKAGQMQVSPDAKGQVANLFEYLKRAVPEALRPLVDTNPEAFLNALIDTPQSRALGKQLQEAMGALPTATSAQEALLAALVLEADPAGRLERNNLAGYNLHQPDNKGRPPAEIVKRFEAHLKSRVGPEMAKAVAYQLLAMAAPEFLVKDLPQPMVYGSLQWASFSAAVSRRELNTTGSSAGQSYEQIMQRNALAPVTEVELHASQIGSIQSVVEWGITNGVIEESREGHYSPEAIQRASNAMQKQAEGLMSSTQALSASIPTRRDLAMAELKRVYGEENADLFEQEIFKPSGQPTRNKSRYSLVDIYMSGELRSYHWDSKSDKLYMSALSDQFDKLSNIETLFNKQFDQYSSTLGKAAGENFQYQLSLLPAEDRERFERGGVDFHHLSASALTPFPDGNEDHPLFKLFGDGAVFIDTVLDGKVQTYIYSPTLGKIIRPGEPLPGVPEGWSLDALVRTREGGEGLRRTRYGLTVGDKTYELNDDNKLTKSVAALPASQAVVPPTRSASLADAISAVYDGAVGKLKESAYGTTEREKVEAKRKFFNKTLLSFLPFHDFIKSIKEGNKHDAVIYGLFDFIGLVVPAFKGGYQAAKTGATGIRATMSFLKGFAKAGLKGANPFGSIYDAGTGLFKLSKTAIKALPSLKLPSLDFDSLRHMSGRSGSWNIPHNGYKQTIADGTYRALGENGTSLPAVATQQNGKWYALDTKTMTHYGPELKNFTPVTVKELRDLRLDTGSAIKTVNDNIDVIKGYQETRLGQASLNQRVYLPNSEGGKQSNVA